MSSLHTSSPHQPGPRQPQLNNNSTDTSSARAGALPSCLPGHDGAHKVTVDTHSTSLLVRGDAVGGPRLTHFTHDGGARVHDQRRRPRDVYSVAARTTRPSAAYPATTIVPSARYLVKLALCTTRRRWQNSPRDVHVRHARHRAQQYQEHHSGCATPGMRALTLRAAVTPECRSSTGGVQISKVVPR